MREITRKYKEFYGHAEYYASTKKLVGIGFCGLSDQELTNSLVASLIVAYMVS